MHALIAFAFGVVVGVVIGPRKRKLRRRKAAETIGTSSRPIREIPNPQVIDAADQFRDAWRLLIGQPPFSGVLLPALHNACIAVELYLKALFADEIEVADDAGDGGYYIYATSPTPHHRLAHLYDRVPADFRAAIEREAKANLRLGRYASFRGALEDLEGLFLSSRYPFEATAEISRVPLEVIDAIVSATDTGIRTIPPRIEYRRA